MMRTRTLIPASRRPYFDAKSGCFLVPLTKGLHAKISHCDVRRVARFFWFVTNVCLRNGLSHSIAVRRRRAHRGPHNGSMPLQLFLLGIAVGDTSQPVLFRNGDRLDCRRENMFIGTVGSRNTLARKRRGATSKYKGVHWSEEKQRWQASITVDGVRRHLGRYREEADAARAYDAACIKYRTDYRLNFPDAVPGATP